MGFRMISDPRYSMRALARQLQIAPGPMSALLKGSKVWNISEEWAAAVLDKMKLKPAQRKRMMALMGLKPPSEGTQIPQNLSGLSVDHWAYWPVLCCFDVPELARSKSKIAERLRLNADEVTHIISDLERRRFLVRDENGHLRRPVEYLATTDDISSDSIRLLHKINLDLAKEALRTVPVQEREFQTLTVAGSSETLQEIKKEIRDFTERIAHLINRDQGNDRVFRISVQLFPVDSGENNVS